jgi:hypothetical protein
VDVFAERDPYLSSKRTAEVKLAEPGIPGHLGERDRLGGVFSDEEEGTMDRDVQPAGSLRGRTMSRAAGWLMGS